MAQGKKTMIEKTDTLVQIHTQDIKTKTSLTDEKISNINLYTL